MSIGFIVVGMIVTAVGLVAHLYFGSMAAGEKAVEIDLRRKQSLDAWEMQQLTEASIDAQIYIGRVAKAKLFISIGTLLVIIGIVLALLK